jgi:hypothetical protein
VRSLLLHRRSWGSGRWRCTWTANSRQIPPMIQRYIPTNVQRSVSNSSEDWVMGVSLAWVLLPIYFRASSRRRGWRRRAACSVRNGTDGRDGLVAVWPRLAGGRTREVVISCWGGSGHQGFPFMAAAGGNGQLTQPGIWCRQHGARQWSAREVLAARVWLREKMAGWRHGVARSWHYCRWGPTV